MLRVTLKDRIGDLLTRPIVVPTVRVRDISAWVWLLCVAVSLLSVVYGAIDAWRVRQLVLAIPAIQATDVVRGKYLSVLRRDEWQIVVMGILGNVLGLALLKQFQLPDDDDSPRDASLPERDSLALALHFTLSDLFIGTALIAAWISVTGLVFGPQRSDQALVLTIAGLATLGGVALGACYRRPLLGAMLAGGMVVALSSYYFWTMSPY